MASSKKPKKPKKPKKRKKTYLPEPSIYKKKAVEPPEGFELVEASEDTIDEARQKINKLLVKTCNKLDITCWSRTHPYYKANEADGWIVVSGVKGIDTSNIVSMIQEIMLPDVPPDSPDYNFAVLGKGFWITVGFRWQGTGSEDELDQYKKYHGMIEVSSNYRPMISRARILSSFSVGQLPSSKNPNSMITNIERKFNKTIGEIFVKINWNSKNIQPMRSEPEEKWRVNLN